MGECCGLKAALSAANQDNLCLRFQNTNLTSLSQALQQILGIPQSAQLAVSQSLSGIVIQNNVTGYFVTGGLVGTGNPAASHAYVYTLPANPSAISPPIVLTDSVIKVNGNQFTWIIGSADISALLTAGVITSNGLIPPTYTITTPIRLAFY